MVKKKRHDSCYTHKALAAVLLFLLLISILFAILLSQYPCGSSKAKQVQIIFLKPDMCDNSCVRAEESLKAYSEEVSIDFSSMRYEQSLMVGYIIMHDGSVLISGYADLAHFKEQVCGFTMDNKVCG
ncbi:MAG: hypothetical protein KKE20_06895 [Nanoarchaeota archaeon]|nr:hypothetical protein [Nanoarchaeota archaeon]